MLCALYLRIHNTSGAAAGNGRNRVLGAGGREHRSDENQQGKYNLPANRLPRRKQFHKFGIPYV